MLENRYLYCKGLSLEIFTLIFNKLISLGYCPLASVEDLFHKIRHSHYLVSSEDNNYFTVIEAVTKHYNSIMISNLLGYDPIKSLLLLIKSMKLLKKLHKCLSY